MRALLLLSLAALAYGQEGFSPERLQQARQILQSDIDKGSIPGAVLLIERNGKIVTHDSLGFQDASARTPMRKDTIFRIASMTKPVIAVAAMMLVEENKLDLTAPVALYLPEFKDVKVGVERADPKRPMTVQDLFRHTSGLTYGVFGNTAVDKMYMESGVFQKTSLAEMVKTIASLPLLQHPGEAWEYSVSTDVLGRVIEVVSGMELDRFLAERVTGPLHMKDTGFWVKADDLARVAKYSGLGGGDPARKPAILSGGGGLLSTAADYARFCQMLLNGGELDGVRLLSPRTIALMVSDHLTPSMRRHAGLGAFAPVTEMGQGFGLGFAVRTHAGRNPLPGSAGQYFWVGITGTSFFIDPQLKLAAILMVQSRQHNVAMWRRARTIVYPALLE